MLTKRKLDILRKGCPSAKLLDIIASRWVALVVYVLESEEVGYNGLKRYIKGISDKMLTQTLRNLERDGIVAKKKVGRNGSRVEYSLTPLGRTLEGPLGSICMWAEKNADNIEAARRAFRGHAGKHE